MNGNGPLAGLALEYKYDNKGRPESLEALHNDEVFHGVKYSYGDAGRLAAVSNDHAQVGYSYDPVKQTMAQQAFQTFSGDHAQTLVQNTRSYDHLNRLESTSYHSTQHAAGGAKALAHHGYTYNALNQRTRAELLDGSYWDYGYNNRGELVKAKHKDKAGTELTGQQFGYNYDAMGNRLGASDGTSDTAMANTYTPDALNQYSSIMTSSVKYVIGTAPAASAVTLNGDATQRQGDYFSGILNADNAAPLWQKATVSDGSQTTAGDVYIPAANVAPEYDADGNLRNDGRWIYRWNGENRLIEMEPTAAALSAGMPYAKLRFRYDSQGRRILREQFNTAGSLGPDSTIHYLYDGWNCIAELDESNTSLRKYVWGTDLSGSMQGAGGVGGLLWVEDETSLEKHFYGYDGNGNVVLTSNMATGSISAEYSYSPFGETIKATGSYADENRYRFSTKPQDEVTGLLYYGYRYYDPVTGRWPNRDPIGERGGINLYQMVSNDPVNLIDFLGLVDIKMVLTRTKKNKNDTTGTLTATPTDEKARECCGTATVQTIELKTGKFTRKTNNKTKNFPIPEDTDRVTINDPSRTGTPQIISRINQGQRSQGRPTFPVPADMDNRNFHIRNVTGFGGICIHAGTTANASEGCIIVGDNMQEVNNVTNPDANGPSRVTLNVFHPNQSTLAMKELLDLYDCVKKHLKRTPSMQIEIKNDF